jgi:murein DD-endopeptidase MepM/ murein hydrolase activator NlpD
MIYPVNKLKIAYFPKGDITQYFGENPQLYGRMGMKGHNGIDIVRPHGEVMYAIEDGVVVECKDDPKGYGRHLRFISDGHVNGVHREWTYGHNAKNLVKQGDKVQRGQAIALMGNTGFVVSGATPYWRNNPYAGTHLHLGLRLVKLPRRGGWSYPGSKVKLDVLNYDNGYKGSVDPINFLWEMENMPEQHVWRQMALTLIGLANTFINLAKKQ